MKTPLLTKSMQLRCKKSFKLVILTSTVLLISACSKQPIRGCKDVVADNYSSTAEEDDGSCAYSAELVFYMSAETAKTLQTLGIKGGDFYVNKEKIGSLSTSQALEADPSCSSAENVLKKTIRFTNSNNNWFTFSTIDENDRAWVKEQKFENVVLISTGMCNIYYW